MAGADRHGKSSGRAEIRQGKTGARGVREPGLGGGPGGA